MSSMTDPVELRLRRLAGDDSVAAEVTQNQCSTPAPAIVEKAVDLDLHVEKHFDRQDQETRQLSHPEVIHKPKPYYREIINFSDDYMLDDAMQGSKINMFGGDEDRGGDGDADGPFPPYIRRKWNPPHRYFTANPYPVPPMASKRKRPVDENFGGVGGNESKKPKTIGPHSTATMLLNECHPGLIYNFSNQMGPPHDPIFEVTLFYPPNGKEYNGSGRSKKLAKHNVSEKVLVDLGRAPPPPPVVEDVIIPEPMVEDEEPSIKIEPDEEMLPESTPEVFPATHQLVNSALHLLQQPEIDFTSDDLAMCVSGYASPQPLPLPPPLEASYVSDMILKRIWKTNIHESPCMALHGILDTEGELNYEFLPEDMERPAHDKIFQVKLMCRVPSWITSNQIDINRREFIGTGSSKKGAKADGARQALISILGQHSYNSLVNIQANSATITQVLNPRPSRKSFTQPVGPIDSLVDGDDPEAQDYSLPFAQQAARLVVDKHFELVKDDQQYSSQKVLAGVVMTLGSPLVDNMHILSVTTGTKCIAGDYLSDKGLALNDCHAEILATRCLRDFLYSQIEALRSIENSSEDQSSASVGLILERMPSTDDGLMRFKLKEGVKFHLYISTSPCGDARIFSPKGLELSDDDSSSPESPCAPGEEVITDTHPNRVSRGILRAKIEAGEGTIPITNLNKEGPQTWDGIMMGNALRTMSCSDKVCKWNVIGAQGALLSLFMDPVYYSSIILGSLHHPVHFKRAVYSRIESLPALDPPFRVNKPRLLMVADKGKRRVTKSPNHSIIWSCSRNAHEVISSAKGICEPGGVVSRLTKRLIFTRFLKVYKNESGWKENFANISYSDAKKLATTYQISKSRFMTFMKECGYGVWISKPMEQDEFYLQ